MKGLIEAFISTILFVLILFGIASYGLTELQLVNARSVHTSVVNQVQSSYYSVNVDELNDKLTHNSDGSVNPLTKDWRVDIEWINASPSRQDCVVTLTYKVVNPAFGITQWGQIQGYAR